MTTKTLTLLIDEQLLVDELAIIDTVVNSWPMGTAGIDVSCKVAAETDIMGIC